MDTDDEREVIDMASVETPTFLATGGTSGDGMGAGGIGGGLLGGILAGALFGNGGLNNRNNNGEGCVTPSMLTAGLAGVTDALQSTTILQTLGDIKASVPPGGGASSTRLGGQHW